MPFPVKVLVTCNPNPPSEAVTAYHFWLDHADAGTSPRPGQPVVVNTAGTHIFGVSAINQWGESAPTEVTVKITPAGKPTAVRVRQG